MDGGGAGGDLLASSTAPLTWHDFLERMRQPSAVDFVKSIKSFIVSFSNKVPNPENDSAAVQEFLTNMEGAFRAHPLWAGCSEEELESAGEGLEKYVMTKLFNRAFASIPEEAKHDEELSEKMALVQQFIRPENLDIKPTFQNETSWLLAQKELQKINMYKAPRDKLVCILNCCKVINNLLLNASLASSENPPGADEFLPVLIYVTLKANPPNLHSNLLYIQRYRRQSRLVSEAAYYFTNVLSAESFIWNIDAQSLSMDEVEFQKNMESAKALLLGLSSDVEGHNNQSTHDMKTLSPSEFEGHKLERKKAKEVSNNKSRTMHHPQSQASEDSKEWEGKDQSTGNRPSISVLETKGSGDLLKEDQPSRYFNKYPFIYAHAGDLTVDDVEALLDSYKQLVLKYVSLSRAIATDNPSHPLSSNNKPSEETENSKEPGSVTETETNSEKFGDLWKGLDTSNVNTNEEVDSIAYNLSAVESAGDSSSEKKEISS